jgi:hypothetical protein
MQTRNPTTQIRTLLLRLCLLRSLLRIDDAIERSSPREETVVEVTALVAPMDGADGADGDDGDGELPAEAEWVVDRTPPSPPPARIWSLRASLPLPANPMSLLPAIPSAPLLALALALAPSDEVWSE